MTHTIAIAPVRKSVLVKADQTRAFDVFTAGFSRWWPKAHHIGAAEMREGIIEARQGGRWYEIGVDGSECDWGEVLRWEPPHRVVLSWHLNGEFKFDPDVETEVEITFTPEGANATRVHLEHRYLERFGRESGEALRRGVDSPGGWSGLLELYASEVAS
jgi:uncharacterized protein YndB with AHSA1/START domain